MKKITHTGLCHLLTKLVQSSFEHFFPRSLDFSDIKQCFKRTFLAEIQIFSKKVHDITLYKRSQNEYRWMVLMAESWEHNEIFYQNIMIFWQNISLCSQISAVSTIQLWLNLACFGIPIKCGIFKRICFLTQNVLLKHCFMS